MDIIDRFSTEKLSASETKVVIAMSDELTTLRQQLVLKELENNTLRGALTMIAEDGWLSCGVEGLDEVQQKVYDIYVQPPVTTEHLQAWLKEQIGEPIAVTKDNGLILKYGFDDLPVNTNLHAVKE